MNLFFSKTLQHQPAAVDVLKKTRTKYGFSISAIAKHLSIAPKFVESLEEARYNKLPGTVYIKNFIRNYAHLLKLDGDEIVAQYENERAESFKKKPLNQFIPVCKIKSPALTLRRAAVATLAFFLVIYLGLEIWGIYKAPPLNLESPTEELIVTEPTLLIKGTTAPEMRLQINGVETVSNSEGVFSENVTLNPGNNQIVVTAIKKHGRSQTLIRNVVYREK